MSHLGHDKEAVELPTADLVLMLLCTIYYYLRDQFIKNVGNISGFLIPPSPMSAVFSTIHRQF